MTFSKIEHQRINHTDLKQSISYFQCRIHLIDKITINFHIKKQIMFQVYVSRILARPNNKQISNLLIRNW